MAYSLFVADDSFHVGSGCRDPMTYVDSIRNSKELFDFGNDLGFKMNLLDIGGGFPGQESAPIKFEDVSSRLDWFLEFKVILKGDELQNMLKDQFNIICGYNRDF